MEARHRYVVEFTRNVSVFGCGKDAYTQHYKRKTFVYGKYQEYKTGKEAYSAAKKYAEGFLNQSSSVSIWKMNGGSGYGEYLKEDRNSRFKTGW